MIEYPVFYYFALAIIGPLMIVRGASQLNNAAFLRDWASNEVITVMDVWRTATYRLTISLIVLFIMKEKPEWIGDEIAIVAVVVALFGGSAIYELFTLKSRVGSHRRTLPPRLATITSLGLILGGSVLTYAIWLHPILFKTDLVGIST